MPKKSRTVHIGEDDTGTVKAIELPGSSILPSWDDIDNDTEILEKTLDNGSKKLIYKKKKPEDTIDERPGIEYPEIIFYLISRYIHPETIGNFALINKAAYTVTKNKSFWMLQFKRHCEGHPKLTHRLQVDSHRAYGLQQTVIRSFYLTYDVFIKRIVKQDIKPHSMVGRVCINSWCTNGLKTWKVIFKLKRRELNAIRRDEDFIEEMGRIDANPEEGTQALLVTCKNFQDVPPLMGMTLTSVNMTLSQGYRDHKLYLGFNSSQYAVKGIVPEREVILNGVIGTLVCDWWHPQYPQTSHFIPRHDPPLLRTNFFDDDFALID